MARTIVYQLGIDIGGTKIAAVLLRKGKTIESSVLATPKDSLEHFLIMVQAVIDPLRERATKDKARIGGIGIGCLGAIDSENGQVLLARNLPILNKIKLIDALRRQLNEPELPMMIDNDVNCFMRAEALLGAAKGSSNAYGLAIGTGIGGGWWRDGNIYHGNHGASTEPGHIIIDFDHLLTLEQAYHKMTQNNAGLLADEARRGDLLAEKTFVELGAYLGIALSNIVNLLSPEIIVLGGGVLASSDLFLKEATVAMRQHTYSPAGRSVKLVKGKLGPLAGAIGAALLIPDQKIEPIKE